MRYRKWMPPCCPPQGTHHVQPCGQGDMRAIPTLAPTPSTGRHDQDSNIYTSSP